MMMTLVTIVITMSCDHTKIYLVIVFIRLTYYAESNITATNGLRDKTT